MRYLLHSSEATYNSTTKKFVYSLDRRIQDPVSIKLTKASFVCSTAAEYPPVVYVRSDGLSRLCKSKHTVALKNEGHEDGTNIIAVLEERHVAGKFSLEELPRVLPVKKHENVTEIDLFFTDNGTVLDGVYTPTEVPGTTDVMMEAHVSSGDIRVWLDLSKDGSVLNNVSEQAALEDSVTKIISRAPGGTLQMNTSGQNKVKFAALGSGRAVARQGTASWGSISGSATNLPDLDEGHHFFLFKSPPDASQLDVLWQSGSLHCFVWSDQIQFKDPQNGYNQTGLVVLDSTDYLLEFDYDAVTCDVHLTKLSDNSTQTAEDQGPIQDPDGTTRSFSTAQTHMQSHHGDYVHCTSAAADDVRAYLKQRYNGEATVPVVDPDGKDASFFLELEIRA